MSEKENKSALDKAAEAYLDYSIAGKAYKATKELVDSGKAKSVVGVVGYGVGYADAKINEALGLGVLNDIQVKKCDDFSDTPIIGTLSAPGCQAARDVVAKRGK
jgi:hypothetical protein